MCVFISVSIWAECVLMISNCFSLDWDHTHTDQLLSRNTMSCNGSGLWWTRGGWNRLRRLDVQDDRDDTDTTALIPNNSTSPSHTTRSTKRTKPQTAKNNVQTFSSNTEHLNSQIFWQRDVLMSQIKVILFSLRCVNNLHLYFKEQVYIRCYSDNYERTIITFTWEGFYWSHKNQN